MLCLFVACQYFQSPEERLIHLKQDRKQKIDHLYAEYGGNSILQNVNQSIDQNSSTNEGVQGFLNTVKNGLQEVDRQQFEVDCIQMGKGDNVPFFTDKAKTFFGQSATQKTCMDVALMDVEIQKLEIQIQQKQ